MLLIRADVLEVKLCSSKLTRSKWTRLLTAVQLQWEGLPAGQVLHEQQDEEAAICAVGLLRTLSSVSQKLAGASTASYLGGGFESPGVPII